MCCYSGHSASEFHSCSLPFSWDEGPPGNPQTYTTVVTDAEKDLNIVFPIERLREFVSEGIIGKVADAHYTFMGHILGPHIYTLMEVSAPEVAARLKKKEVDYVLLTPG